MQLLVFMAERPGTVLSRETLLKAIWGDEFVCEQVLTNAISQIRHSFGGAGRDYVETIPKTGYRLIANVLPKIVVDPAGEKDNNKKRWIIAAVIAVLLAATGATLWVVKPVQQSIAVRPFVDLSPTKDQQYFADGLAEEIINDLAGIPNLKVVARSVSFQVGKNEDARTVGRKLHVRSVLEGTFHRENDRVRITVQLINVANGYPIWSNTYYGNVTDVFAVQDEIARAVANALNVVLATDPKRRGSAHPIDPKVYEAYLRGRYFANKFSRQPLLKAVDYLQQAIDMDPTYSPVYAELAHVCLKLAFASGPEQSVPSSPETRELISRARTLAQKAVQLDPALAQGHTMNGMVSIYFDFHMSEGRRELERAVAMAPDSADALIHASLWRALTGQTIEARKSTEAALKLEPLSVEVSTLAGQAFFRLRDYDRAIEQLKSILEVDPNLPRAYGLLYRVYEAKQMYSDAVAAYQKVVELNGGTPQEIAAPGIAFAKGGIRGFWLFRLQELNEATEKGYDSPVERARLHALLGDKEKALKLLERAYQQQDYTVYTANVGYEFDKLRSDPRFQNLLRRMNFPP